MLLPSPSASLLFAVLVGSTAIGHADEPGEDLGLPSLDDEEVPDGAARSEGEARSSDDDGDLRDRLDSLPFDLSLRLEGRVGSRTYSDAPIDRLTLGETRLQVHVEKHLSTAELRFVAITDFLYDSLGDT